MTAAALAYLADPSLDAAAQQETLSAARVAVQDLTAELPDLAPWLTGMEAVLTGALSEIEAGISEGMDQARADFMELAELLARVGVAVVARTLPGASLGEALVLHRALAAFLAAQQGLRGARQVLSWVAGTGALQGRLPILSLSIAGRAALVGLNADPLTAEALSRADAANALNDLAEMLAWRA